MFRFFSLLLAVSLVWLSGCGARAPVQLTVSAAASLTDALQEIKGAYEAGHPGVKVNFNLGASGTLQQQIEQGAPADLFLSAAAKNMKILVDRNLIAADKQTTLLSNKLVVIVPADAKDVPTSLADLGSPAIKHLAIGIPDTVPAGSYAKEALVHAKAWDVLQPKTVQAKDVRQVLDYVESGNADAGFVYQTDALSAHHAKVAFAVDPAAYTPITYPAGIIKATKHPKEAEDFYRYLQSKPALAIFAKYGFTAPQK